MPLGVARLHCLGRCPGLRPAGRTQNLSHTSYLKVVLQNSIPIQIRLILYISNSKEYELMDSYLTSAKRLSKHFV